MDRSTDMRFGSHAATYRYIAETFCEEDSLLQAIKAKGEELVPGMQVSPVEGKALYVLASLIQAKHILEIGTFVGYSTLWLARALPKDGSLITLEFNAEHARHARAYFDQSEQAEQIEIRQGKALDSLKVIAQESHQFDLVFIDAAKAEYPEYVELFLPQLRKGGLILGDNSLLWGNLTGEAWQHASETAIAGMRRFNDILADPQYFSGTLLPTVEGLTVAVKK
ncbi:MAG: O-methyltransferase [Rickettsiales bacterium]